MTGAQIAPRKLWTVAAHVDAVLDLTDARSRQAVGITDADISTPIRQYAATQAVALAAHRVGLHGILAPAAEGPGQTFAVFDDMLTEHELLDVVDVTDPWQVPSDPRATASGSGPSTSSSA